MSGLDQNLLMPPYLQCQHTYIHTYLNQFHEKLENSFFASFYSSWGYIFSDLLNKWSFTACSIYVLSGSTSAPFVRLNQASKLAANSDGASALPKEPLCGDWSTAGFPPFVSRLDARAQRKIKQFHSSFVLAKKKFPMNWFDLFLKLPSFDSRQIEIELITVQVNTKE